MKTDMNIDTNWLGKGTGRLVKGTGRLAKGAGRLAIGVALLLTGFATAACESTGTQDVASGSDGNARMERQSSSRRDRYQSRRDRRGRYLAPEEIRPGLTVPHMDEDPIRVALLLPLSHSRDNTRVVAQALLNSAELALFEIENVNVMLMPKDTFGTRSGARRAAREAVAEGADLILGPLFAASVREAGRVARRAGVPMIAFSTDREVAGDGVYLLSFLPEQEVKRVVDFAFSEGYYSFAALIPQSAYGYRVRSAFEYSVERQGGYIPQMQSYPRVAEEMFAPARIVAEYDRRKAALEQKEKEDKLGGEREPSKDMVFDAETGTLVPSSPLALDQAYGPATGGFDEEGNPLELPKNQETWGGVSYQAVLLPEGGTLLRSLAPLLPYFDVDPRQTKFLGTGLWDDETLGKEPSLVGGWFAAPSPEMRNAFSKRYKDAYGKMPPRIASLGFDAVALASSLAGLPERIRFAPETLASSSGFAGIDGIFRFLPDGSSERGLAVIQVNAKGLEVISPAPTTFQREDVLPRYDDEAFSRRRGDNDAFAGDGGFYGGEDYSSPDDEDDTASGRRGTGF
jgi:X-X-X-Leu-X-X-Gly heptad repeat protein